MMKTSIDILTGENAQKEIGKRKADLKAMRERVIKALCLEQGGNVKISESLTVLVHVLGGLVAASSVSESDLLDNITKVVEGLRTVSTNTYVCEKDKIQQMQKGMKYD